MIEAKQVLQTIKQRQKSFTLSREDFAEAFVSLMCHECPQTSSRAAVFHLLIGQGEQDHLEHFRLLGKL